MGEWKNIEPGMWKPEKEGDNIIGEVVSKEPKDDAAGVGAKYHVKNDEGTFLIWGSAVLDDRMKLVEAGQKVRITYKGKTKNKRNQDVNMYVVDVWEGEDNDEPVGVEDIEDAE